MEALHCNAFSLTHPISSSSPITRPTSSFTPISSAALYHKASSDSPLSKDAHAETPISASSSIARSLISHNDHALKEAYAGTPISASSSIARSLISHNDHALKEDYAENPSPSSSRAKAQKKTLILMRNNAASGYAAALAEMGQSKHILDLIYADLKKLGTFLQHKQLHSFLLHPSIHDTHKKNILTCLANDHAFVPYTLKLLNLIVDKKRASLLKDVVKEFEVIYNKMADTEVAVVLSATEMDAAQLAHIAERMQSMSGSKNVRMKNVLDASLVAGYIVKHGKDGSHLIDMSVKAYQGSTML